MIELPLQFNSKSCTINRDALIPCVKKLLGKSKNKKTVRLDFKTGQLESFQKVTQPSALFLEAPLILLPDFELLNLVKLGKCCAYCGEVLKADDQGRMRDTKKKRRSSRDSKKDRFIAGLDCDQCPLRWCSKACKKADFKHCILHHQPENKSNTNPFLDLNGKCKDMFNYGSWTKLSELIVTRGLEICYYGVMSVLYIYHNPSLQPIYEGLRHLSDSSEKSMIRFLCDSCHPLTENDLRTCHELLIDCFKKMTISFDKFLLYLTIYKLNNFSGCLYLLASFMERKVGGKINCKIGYHDITSKEDTLDSLLLEPISENSVRLVESSHLEDNTKIPIFYSSGVRVRKRILKVSSTGSLDKNQPLAIEDYDYSIPMVADEEFAIAIESMESEFDELTLKPNRDNGKFLRSHSNSYPRHSSTSALLQVRRTEHRAASFTSSGNSFGEGIIKYNRTQIREMLQKLTYESGIDEGSESDFSANETESNCSSSLMLEVPTTFGKTTPKTVRFDDNVIIT